MTENISVEGSEVPTQETPLAKVPVEQASYEDLSAYLTNNSTEDTDEGDESLESDEVESEEEGEETATEASPNQAKEGDAKQNFTREEVEGLLKQYQERVAKKEAQVEQQEVFIKRRNNELGAARKELEGYKARLEASLENKYLENPKEAIADQIRVREIDSKLEQIDQEQHRTGRIEESQRVFSQFVKDDEVSFDAMAHTLKEIGIPDEGINRFVQNPFEFATGTELVFLAQATQAKAVLKYLVDKVKPILEENKQLKEKGRPETIIKRVNEAANRTLNVTGKNGGSVARPKNFSAAEIANMPTTELKDLFKSLT